MQVESAPWRGIGTKVCYRYYGSLELERFHCSNGDDLIVRTVTMRSGVKGQGGRTHYSRILGL